MQKRSYAGFTLVELVIVMLIVSILIAIALPAYTKYVTRSRRAAAEACLSNYANYMERFYATNMQYKKDTAGTNIALPVLDCATGSNTGQYYTYSLDSAALTESAYSLLATPTPNSSQLKNDGRCGTLSISQTGLRGKSGAGAVTDCWAH